MKRYRWLVCGLLFLGVSVLYVDRQILSLLKPLLDEQMKWSDQQFGWINSAFLGAYGLSMVASGWLIDRFGTKVGYVVTMVAWSASALCTSLVSSVRGFVFARFAVGGSEGGCFPTSIKAIALWFPKRERAFATSLFNSGSNFGAILAPACIPWVAFHWGWKGAYVAAGLAGLVWLLLWMRFYAPPERMAGLDREELDHILSDRDPDGTDAGRKTSWLGLLGHRQTWSFVAAKFITDPIWWFFLIWLPDFFKKARGLDLKHSWIHLVAIYSIVTVLSILGGWITGRLIRGGWSVTRARKTGLFAFALCVLPILAVTYVGDWTVVLLIGLAGAAHQAWSANLFTTVSDMFPKRAVASVTGLGGLAGAVGSMLFQPLTGALLDYFKVHGGEAIGYKILFGLCASAYFLAFAIQHLCAPTFEPFYLEEQK